MLREALELCPPGHPFRDASLNNLANALSKHYNYSGSLGELEEAIQMYREALVLRPPGHPYRVKSLKSLASVLGERYDRLESRGDVEQSILLAKETVAICPLNHPWHASASLVLAECLRRSTDPRENSEEVLQILKGGLSDNTSPLEDCLRCGLLWIELASELHHVTLGEAYSRCINFLRHYLTIGPTAKLQY